MDLLGVGGLPYLARRNYYYEFLHLIPWGVLVGMIEGNAASIVVAKTFQGTELLIATASATPIGALLFSSIWSMLCIGRPKIRLATIFAAATALSAATVALTPHSPTGGILFIVQMAAAQVFLSGVVTVRSALWKHNYPPEARGRIAARLQAVRLIVSLLVVLGASSLFDYDPALYRFAYPVVAASGLIAILILQNIHVRHEKTELRRMARDNALQQTLVQRASLRESISPRFLLRGMTRVLRDDRRYTRYLAAQMVFGVGIQSVIPVLVVVISRAAELYLINALLIELLPKLMMFASLRRWGRFFDRVGINRYRVYTSSCAAAGLLLGMIATIIITAGPETPSRTTTFIALSLFGVRGLLHGLHQGGGTLAWNLGHLHYANRDDAELYMGVHQTLTGARGLIAPFIGIALWHAIGWGVWVVALTLCLAATVSYHRLAAEDAPDRQRV